MNPEKKSGKKLAAVQKLLAENSKGLVAVLTGTIFVSLLLIATTVVGQESGSDISENATAIVAVPVPAGNISTTGTKVIFSDTFNEPERLGTNGSDKWKFHTDITNKLSIINVDGNGIYQYDVAGRTVDIRSWIASKFTELPTDFKVSLSKRIKQPRDWESYGVGSLRISSELTNPTYNYYKNTIIFGYAGHINEFHTMVFVDGKQIYKNVGLPTTQGEWDGTDGKMHKYSIEKIGNALNFYKDNVKVDSFTDARIGSVKWNSVSNDEMYNSVTLFDDFIVEDLTIAKEDEIVKNGDFSQNRAYWTFVGNQNGGNYPTARILNATNGKPEWVPFLSFDVPYGTTASVEQVVSIPQTNGKVELSFDDWGANDPVTLTVTLDGKTVGSFKPLTGANADAIRKTKIYDISEFNGLNVALKFSATGPSSANGDVVNIDNIAIKLKPNDLPSSCSAIKNGDFNNDLDGWEALSLNRGSYLGYPKIYVTDYKQPGNPYVVLDTPGNAVGEVRQLVTVPNSTNPKLEFKVFGNEDPTTATIKFGNVTLDSFIVPRTDFKYGEQPVVKSYDMGNFSGKTDYIGFYSTSPYGTGTFSSFDHVNLTNGLCNNAKQNKTTSPAFDSILQKMEDAGYSELTVVHTQDYSTTGNLTFEPMAIKDFRNSLYYPYPGMEDSWWPMQVMIPDKNKPGKFKISVLYASNDSIKIQEYNNVTIKVTTPPNYMAGDVYVRLPPTNPLSCEEILALGEVHDWIENPADKGLETLTDKAIDRIKEKAIEKSPELAKLEPHITLIEKGLEFAGLVECVLFGPEVKLGSAKKGYITTWLPVDWNLTIRASAYGLDTTDSYENQWNGTITSATDEIIINVSPTEISAPQIEIPQSGTSGGGGGGGSSTIAFVDKKPESPQSNSKQNIQPASAPSGSSTSQNIIDLSLKFDTEKEVAVTFDKGDKVKIKVANSDHHVVAKDINANSVTFVIMSDPIEITLGQGESALVDVNKDGHADLSIFVKKILSGRAITTITSTEKIAGRKTTGGPTAFAPLSSNPSVLTAIVGGVLIGGIALYTYNARRGQVVYRPPTRRKRNLS